MTAASSDPHCAVKMMENDTNNLRVLSNDDLAWVVGGAVLVVEDGKELYPGTFPGPRKSKQKRSRKRGR